MYLAAHFLSLWPGLALHLAFPHLPVQLFFIAGYYHPQGESRTCRPPMSIVKDNLKTSLGSRAVDRDFILWGVQRYMCLGGKSLMTALFGVIYVRNQQWLWQQHCHIPGTKVLGRTLVIYFESQSHPYLNKGWTKESLSFNCAIRTVAVILCSAQHQMFQAFWDLRSPFENTGSSVCSPILFY